MSRFILIYQGEATALDDMSESASREIMAKWEKWMGKVGPALVDVGAPFGEGVSLVDDQSKGTPAALTGYSIVEAGNLSEAERLAEGHPYLSQGKGNYSIELYELAPVPFKS